jgi:MscS family membrane protein
MTIRAFSSLTACGLLLGAVPALPAPAAAAGAGTGSAAHVALSDNLLDRTVAWVQTFFTAEHGRNALGHFIAAGLLFVTAVLLRKVITHVIFASLKRLAAKTTTTLDDKLFPALETPVAWLVFVFLTFAALRVLVLPPGAESWIGYAFDVAWVAVLFWVLLRGLNAIVDHLNEMGNQRGLGLQHFMR